MKSATYKLAKYHGGRSHYAEVTVSAEFSQGFLVEFSSDVFGWLKDVYGPDAWEWAICEDYRAAAWDGVRYALRHMHDDGERVLAKVVIERIHATLCDTSSDDVAEATVRAVWTALGDDNLNIERPLPNS